MSFRKIISSILFLIVFCFSQVNAQWEWLNPFAGGDGIRGLAFANRDVGWILSQYSIRKSTDGGQTWFVQKINCVKPDDYFSMNTIFCVDSMNIYIGGSCIIRSTDGGKNWVKCFSDNELSYFVALSFTDKNNGFGFARWGKIVGTTDGGNSWSTLITQQENPNLILDGTFIDPLTGWVVGYNLLKGTFDGGYTWFDANIRCPLNAVFFLDKNTGWAGGDFLLKTTNGGKNWTGEVDKYYRIQKLYFLDEKNGWCISNTKLMKTTDGGDTWIVTRQFPDNYYYFTSLFFVDKDKGFISNQMFGRESEKYSSLALSITTDAGDTWKDTPYGNIMTLNSVQVVNKNIIWACGEGGAIIKSTDFGSSFIRQKSGMQENLNSFFATDSLNSYAVGNKGVILKTSDGGESWMTQTSNTSYSLYSVSFANSNYGWAVGNGGTILKTSNRGNNWIVQNSSYRNTLRSVFFTDSLHGYACGEGGLLISTSDGGTVWTQYPTNIYSSLQSIFFINKDVGWAAGVNFTIFKTTNGGQNWFSVASVGYTITKISFFDRDNGWCLINTGGDAYLYKSTDGGINWKNFPIDPKELIYSLPGLSLIDSVSGVVCGAYGCIGKFNSTFSPPLQVKEKASFVSALNLNQNYPNPFNPTTIIKYTIPNESKVNLTVYNNLGQKIKELVNEIKPAGAYEVILDGNGLPSGIYFYQLTAGRFSQTKKLVLLK